VDRLIWFAPALYALDRALRLLALRAFFRRAAPPLPETWPSVTVLMPLTRSPNDLRAALRSHAALRYPGDLAHLFVCDAADTVSQSLVRDVLAAHPGCNAQLLLAPSTAGTPASKIAKLQTALPQAHGDVLAFVDDDVRLPADALQTLVRYLAVPGTGAVFGLARYSAWETPWSALMSLFVNAWALPSYVPLTYLLEPYTITGHCFALQREVFERIGGLEGMAQRVDDDHELARRVRRRRLRCVQTPLIYTIENRFATARAYHAQLRRWFILPRQTMAPQLSTRERIFTVLGAAGNLLPPLALLLALFRRRAGLKALALCLILCFGSYVYVDRRYLGGITPLRRLPLLLITALATPVHILAASLGEPVVLWRGQQLHIGRDGVITVLNKGDASCS
jgi:ceramide glucosyltransferase